MPSFFAQLISRLPWGRSAITPQRREAVLCMLLLVAAVLASLLIIDAYALYLSHRGDIAPVASVSPGPALTEQDIDAALAILNEREEKLQLLLGNGVLPAATSTPER